MLLITVFSVFELFFPEEEGIPIWNATTKVSGYIFGIASGIFFNFNENRNIKNPDIKLTVGRIYVANFNVNSSFIKEPPLINKINRIIYFFLRNTQ